MSRVLVLSFSIALSLSAKASDLPRAEGSAVQEDDECASTPGDSSCALNALQRRGKKVTTDDEVEQSAEWHGSCAHYGCPTHYHRWMKCQCNANCVYHGNCCSDYASKCAPTAQTPTHMPLAPAPPIPTGGSQAPSGGAYRMVWQAKGKSFFSNFKFLQNDDNHGSAQYLDMGEAEQAGVAEAEGSYAILRSGPASPQYEFKRMTAKIASSQSWKYFLMTAKFSHVPYGCGVWPAIFTLAPDAAWPDGGEMDLLEYVNMDVSKSSLHTGGNCRLDKSKLNKYGYMPDRNKMDYDCVTHYPKRLGCAPNKWMKTGQGWANSPGAVALQWTESFVKLFFFPEHEIPADMESGTPEPDAWDRWVFAYYPFDGDSCDMQKQELVMQINFCGDWASKVWGDDSQCKYKVPSCRSVDPLAEYAPKEDCCTQWIWDKDKKFGTDRYLAERAFFNISWMKVYQQ